MVVAIKAPLLLRRSGKSNGRRERERERVSQSFVPSVEMRK